MQSWITMNDNHLTNILDIKNYRRLFVESFDTNDIELQNKLLNATKALFIAIFGLYNLL